MLILVYVDPVEGLQRGITEVGLVPVYFDATDLARLLSQQDSNQEQASPLPLTPRPSAQFEHRAFLKVPAREALAQYLGALLRWQNLFLDDQGLTSLPKTALVTRELPLHLLGGRWLAVRDPADEGGGDKPFTDYTLKALDSSTLVGLRGLKGQPFDMIHEMFDEFVEPSPAGVIAAIVRRRAHLQRLEHEIQKAKAAQQQELVKEGEKLLEHVWARLIEAGPRMLIRWGREANADLKPYLLPPAGYDPANAAHRKLVAQALDLIAAEEAPAAEEQPLPITDPMPGPVAEPEVVEGFPVAEFDEMALKS